jgi:hypothetical protein
MSLTFRRLWLVLLACFALGLASLAGCDGDPTPTDPNSGTPPPGGRGEIQGSGATPSSDLTLYEGECPPGNAAVASATSSDDGSFTFAEADTGITSFCVSWEGGEMDCGCDWTKNASTDYEECTCSP